MSFIENDDLAAQGLKSECLSCGLTEYALVGSHDDIRLAACYISSREVATDFQLAAPVGQFFDVVQLFFQLVLHQAHEVGISVRTASFIT